MAIKWYTDRSRRGKAAAENGQYQDAASLFALSAFGRLREYGIRECSNANMAVGDLLRAIHYSRRADTDRTAVILRTTLESVALLLQDAAKESYHEKLRGAASSDVQCLIGLFDEWIGDAHLLTDSSEGADHYNRAETWYERERKREGSHSIPCFGWGMEPEFDAALFALRDHMEWRGLPDDMDAQPLTELAVDFDTRLSFKRRLVERWAAN